MESKKYNKLMNIKSRLTDTDNKSGVTMRRGGGWARAGNMGGRVEGRNYWL